MKDRNTLRAYFYIFLLPIVLFYYECVFHAVTVGGGRGIEVLCRLLFCLAYGGIAYLLTTIIPKARVIRITTGILMGLLAVLYLIEYFIYRQFKVFYDVKTVFLGAEDAVGGFSSEIFTMVFSWDGLWKILLFALPVVLYSIFSKKLFPQPKAGLITRCIGAALVLCFGAGLLVVYKDPILKPAYTNQYNYQSAVGHFGLISGIGLDIRNLNTEKTQGGFEAEPTLPEVTTPTEEVETPVEKVYGYNEMALKLSETSGQIGELNAYVSTLTPSRQNAYTGLFAGKNLIFITAEAFTAEVIDPVLTPTLYRLANQGIRFTDYYQYDSAGTTGGEYQNIFGMHPTTGGAAFKSTAEHYNYMTIGSQLNRLGYYGKAYHNNSYTYYSRHLTHNNLGYSDGFMGYGNGMEKFVQNLWPQSDLEMFQGTVPTFIDKQPFNIYYMSVSGHSNYTRIGNCMTYKNWDKVTHLNYSDMVKGYLAANLELEYALEYLVKELEAKGIADDTVICITSDHFPYGLDEDGSFGKMTYLSELFGYDVTDYFLRDHNALILWSGCLEDMEPIVVDTPTSSLDILPTLSNLFGTEFDSRLFPGRDVFSDAQPLVFNMNYDWKTDLGTYYAASNKFVPKTPDTVIPEGYVDYMKAVVRNKLRYCSLVLSTDYFRYLFA